MTNEDPTAPIRTMTRENPPVSPRYDWSTIAATARAEPMQWFCVFKAGRVSKVNAIRQGKVSPLHPDLGFEVTTTHNLRGQPRLCDLYIRHNPSRVKELTVAIQSTRKKKVI